MRTDVSLEATRIDGWMSAMAITPEQARSASLVLAGHASGADELRLWLEILGLRDRSTPPERSGNHGRAA